MKKYGKIENLENELNLFGSKLIFKKKPLKNEKKRPKSAALDKNEEKLKINNKTKELIEFLTSPLFKKDPLNLKKSKKFMNKKINREKKT